MLRRRIEEAEIIDEQALELAKWEWKLFRRVRNYGGPADCQSQKDTFLAMRCSQFMAWSSSLKASYGRDLEEAAAQGRNLLAEKYAYMMRYTFPEEYAALADRLPAASQAKQNLIESIIPIVLKWSEEMKEKHPLLMATSRPVYSSQDFLGTSIETYTRGELETYSERTLAMLLNYYQTMAAQNINLHEVTDSITVRLYGFDSLAQAEELAEQHISSWDRS